MDQIPDSQNPETNPKENKITINPKINKEPLVLYAGCKTGVKVVYCGIKVYGVHTKGF